VSRSKPWSELPQQKPRTCLKCGQRFLSEGPWNRICRKCAEDNEHVRRHLGKLSYVKGNPVNLTRRRIKYPSGP